MTHILNLRSHILHLALIMFCLPLAFPALESIFITLQFVILFPLYLFLSLFSTSFYGFGLMCLYVFLMLLVPLGMPGSIIGWMSMLCAGYFFGRSVSKQNSITYRSIKPFFYLTILSSLWVNLENYRTGFSQELLSDYFQASSINTVPILIVCSLNLYCGLHYYMSYIAVNRDDTIIKKDMLLYALVFAAVLSTVTFGFRSGILIFVLVPLILWPSLGLRNRPVRNRAVKNIVLYLFAGLGIFFAKDNIYDFLTNLMVPGRTEIASVVGEISKDATRYDRIVEFWSVAGGSKINFDVWSSHFSVSAMSDFMASLFPLSLLFLVPALSMLKLFRYLNSPCRLPAIIIMVSCLSSLLISMLQPDFYSMFTFFSITSLVFVGERKKAFGKPLVLSKLSN